MIELNAKRLAATVACLGALGVAAPAGANVVWAWSFSGGAEAGTVTTNGTLADLAGPFNFVVDPSTIDVTASALAPSLVSQTSFNEGNQPGTGWLWDGSKITQIYRAGGGLTNGLNWYDGTWRLSLALNGATVIGRVEHNLNSTITTNFQNASLAPVTTPVPEPSTTAMLSAGLLVALGAVARRNRAARR